MSFRRSVIPLALTGAAALGAAAPANAAFAPLGGTAAIQIGPLSQPDQLFMPISPGPGLGDVDGDGRDDVALVRQGSEEEGAPATKVVFGRSPVTNVDVTTADPRVRTYPNTTIEAAGDVNGDGTDDVLVTLIAQPNIIHAVVFGGPGIADLRVDQLASRGFRLDGAGYVNAAGDLNGDGRDDLFVLRPSDTAIGAATIVFGKTSTAPVNTAAPGAGGVLLSSSIDSSPNDAVLPARGDVNGDGIDDLSFQNREDGAVVHFGRRTWPRSLDMDVPGSNGFVIDGTYAVLPSTLDFTGDHRADLLVFISGTTAVLPGRSATTRLDAPANAILVGGFGFNSPGVPDVAPAGDLNRDGRDDLVAVRDEDTRVIPGRATGPAVVGDQVPGVFASILWPVGDVDGDSRPDLIAPVYPYVFPGTDLSIRPRHTLITHGRDVLTPTISALPWRELGLSPSAFRAGETTQLLASFSEPGTLEITTRKANGQLIGTFRVPFTTGSRWLTWDGKINGRALAPGDYRATGSLVDPAGNRSEAKSLTFTILP
ncbi:MAG: VCBS repeat-containing protein [Solirubrobacteraceae bacterium]|nr:VCBS repeat-containing protein [Solirubrobacteraceae bacterium]